MYAKKHTGWSSRASLTLHTGIRWGCLVSFMSQPPWPWYPLHRRFGRPHNQSGCVEQETKLLPLPGMELWHLSLAHSLVTTLTELYWLLLLTAVNVLLFQTVLDTNLCKKIKRYCIQYVVMKEWQGVQTKSQTTQQQSFGQINMITDHSFLIEDSFS